MTDICLRSFALQIHVTSRRVRVCGPYSPLWSKKELNPGGLSSWIFQWIPAYVTLIHRNMLSLKSLHGGFEAGWVSIAGECAKPNLKYFFDFFSWQANPVFGGVAFFPIPNSILKVTLYLSKDYHFITFSDKLWMNIKWLSKENLLSGKKLPPQIQGWPSRKKNQKHISGLVWHITQLLRSAQPPNPREVISMKACSYV